jgi:hypothetical protein
VKKRFAIGESSFDFNSSVNAAKPSRVAVVRRNKRRFAAVLPDTCSVRRTYSFNAVALISEYSVVVRSTE